MRLMTTVQDTGLMFIWDMSLKKNALLTSSLYHITSHMYLRTWYDVIFFSRNELLCLISKQQHQKCSGVLYHTSTTATRTVLP